MTLLDRFRAQPPQKHSDPVVRLAYVQEIPIDERNLLAEIAREDVDPRVRRAAVAKLMDPSALASVADLVSLSGRPLLGIIGYRPERAVRTLPAASRVAPQLAVVPEAERDPLKGMSKEMQSDLWGAQ